jgi:hypothetical protein
VNVFHNDNGVKLGQKKQQQQPVLTSSVKDVGWLKENFRETPAKEGKQSFDEFKKRSQQNVYT